MRLGTSRPRASLFSLLSAILLVTGASSALFITGILPSPDYGPGPYTNPSGWKLVFDDELNGSSLDLSKWSYNYPTTFPHGGHAKNHLAYMDEANVIVQGGLLRIVGENRT